MTTGPEDYDEAVIILDDGVDGFMVSDELNTHRIVLESHSFIEENNVVDDVNCFLF